MTRTALIVVLSAMSGACTVARSFGQIPLMFIGLFLVVLVVAIVWLAWRARTSRKARIF